MLGDEFILILSYPHMGPIQDELTDDEDDERSSFFRVDWIVTSLQRHHNSAPSLKLHRVLRV
jgi:hypothetical protein